MDFQTLVKILRAGRVPDFHPDADSFAYADALDAQDGLSHLREQFIIPTRASLKKRALDGTVPDGNDDNDPSVYLIGNSLGAQPRAVQAHVDAQLETWASLGVNGHFTALENSPLGASWQDLAEECGRKFVPIVGAASASEVVVMNTLTTNLHLMMASFYRPTEKRHKILLEWRPFPSDWYAVQSQIAWHGLDPATSMVEIQPDADQYLATAAVLAAIDEHADSAALLLLPGIQYYTGQLLDMARITAHAKARGVPVVGWDLAHAAGNVELRLHEWGVDFAVWCTYKYLNAGPGAIAGAFVHERHHGRDGPQEEDGEAKGGSSVWGAGQFRHRLAGWYGADKSVRFDMAKTFVPTPGAPGYQLSNPSAIDLAALSAALSVFGQTSMAALRDKALLLTAYAEHLLGTSLPSSAGNGHVAGQPAFRIITPANPAERGSQLSLLLLRPGLLDRVSRYLVQNGVVFDARKPDVIRVAPVPMYCSFVDVWRFADVFRRAIAVSSA
ncbi:pyridoxal phosphate-dependent transferase [Lasiosphaeria miniovina]|uniref:Kynureninase n=1 Tax=Lasiosphaeria miniovina TaxID=1954250 RepID=A0AA39ZUU6_9PEZI|nr:pyridoxal phosphate-dependent transferase [Lasiosphaeria miniovina]KAK0703945.1 pyridoxal phosphate-dependent transferase [Lasiosphaeria miniovina]